MIKVMTVALVTSVNRARTARLNSHETREIETSFICLVLGTLYLVFGLSSLVLVFAPEEQYVYSPCFKSNFTPLGATCSNAHIALLTERDRVHC